MLCSYMVGSLGYGAMACIYAYLLGVCGRKSDCDDTVLWLSDVFTGTMGGWSASVLVPR